MCVFQFESLIAHHLVFLSEHSELRKTGVRRSLGEGGPAQWLADQTQRPYIPKHPKLLARLNSA